MNIQAALNQAHKELKNVVDSRKAQNESLANASFFKKGDKGERGPIGPQGMTGKQGPQGERGIMGSRGIQGISGKMGIQGPKGNDGYQGKDGSPDTPDEVRDKLQSLSGDKRLDASSIKNIARYAPSRFVSGGSGSRSSSVSLTSEVTGILPVVNGGTGVTTSTGTGSVVLSTSPTLTTPNIGAATADSVTANTGVTLSIAEANNSAPNGMTITAGNATAINTGGEIDITSGNGFGTGGGGGLVLTAGNSGTTNGASAGGSVNINAGNAGAGSNANGGNFSIGLGLKDGTGTNGVFQINNPTTGYRAALTTSSIATSSKTFTFPNTTGTFALVANPTTLTPSASDGAALGTTSLQWSDLFLASGGVVNFNNGNVTMTHSAAQMVIAGTTTFGIGQSSPDKLFMVNDASAANATTGGVEAVFGNWTVAGRANAVHLVSRNAAANAANNLDIEFDFRNDANNGEGTACTIRAAKNAAADTAGLQFFVGTAGSGTTAEAMRILTGQQVLIGLTSSVAGVLQVLGPDNGTAAMIQINATQANITAADTFMEFRSTSGIEGTIQGTGVAGVIAYNTFTGSHWSQNESIKSDLPAGTVLVSTEEMSSWEGEVANHLPKCKVSTKADDKAVYGVYGGHDKQGDIMVLALGSGKVLVCDEGGKIEIGDFLSTASKTGYAKRYDGNDMRVVLGKARQEFNGKEGEIACTYMCG